MKRVLFLLTLFVATIGVAQNDEVYVDGLIKDFTSELQENGISNYFVVKRFCLGKVELIKIGKKLCSTKGTYVEAFVIWKKGRITLIRKIDNCGMFHTITIEDTAMVDMFLTHSERLKLEQVKKYKTANYTGKPELRTTPQPCGRKFDFTVDGMTFSKSYNLFDISNDSEERNLNYQYNHKLKIVAIDAQLEQKLAEMESELRRVEN